jgi:hypothetical protein
MPLSDSVTTAPFIIYLELESLATTTLLFNLASFLLVRNDLLLNAEIRRGPKPNLSLAQHLATTALLFDLVSFPLVRIVSVFHAVTRRVSNPNLSTCSLLLLQLCSNFMTMEENSCSKELNHTVCNWIILVLDLH